MSRQMIVRLQKIDTTAGDDSFRSHRPLGESSMIAEHANIPPSPLQAEGSNRRLRNRIILVNVVAWVVIIVAIRAIFF
jgi:hypothetical protein